MPELPEVETTRRGILPHILNRQVKQVIIRQLSLRWPVTPALIDELPGQTISAIKRRGKYLLLDTKLGTLLIHLGMSGSLRLTNSKTPPGKHDHVDIVFEGGGILRYCDPRRFGCMLWIKTPIENHLLLHSLGPEPLSEDFDAEYLHRISRNRKQAVKPFIMNSGNVVGVGNIYANEALFQAGINPKRAAGNLSLARYGVLADCIKQVLQNAVDVGGTSLRDFTNSSGEPGYFKQLLQVYGRGCLDCLKCGRLLKEIRLGQRSTVYCTHCQK